MKQSKSKNCKRARTRLCPKENFREPFGVPSILAMASRPQSCFPFESINSHERIMLSQKKYKMRLSKSKSRKRARIF